MTRGAVFMTYDRMEAKKIPGEHCHFCGDETSPLVKPDAVSNGFVVIHPICPFKGEVIVRMSMKPIVFVIFTIMKSIRAIGRNVKNVAVILAKKNLKECPKTG